MQETQVYEPSPPGHPHSSRKPPGLQAHPSCPPCPPKQPYTSPYVARSFHPPQQSSHMGKAWDRTKPMLPRLDLLRAWTLCHLLLLQLAQTGYSNLATHPLAFHVCQLSPRIHNQLMHLSQSNKPNPDVATWFRDDLGTFGHKEACILTQTWPRQRCLRLEQPAK